MPAGLHNCNPTLFKKNPCSVTEKWTFTIGRISSSTCLNRTLQQYCENDQVRDVRYCMRMISKSYWLFQPFAREITKEAFVIACE